MLNVRWSLVLTFVLLFIIGNFAKTVPKNGSLSALWNLNQMAECHLGYSALAYNDYGCWCGVGGAGTPMDGIDTCCMNHDHCYDKAIADGACFDVPIEYMDDYSWGCVKKEPNCVEPQSPCQAYLCWCDKTVVDCWGDYLPPPAKVSCVPHKSYTKNDETKNGFLQNAYDFMLELANTTIRLPSKIADFFRGVY